MAVSKPIKQDIFRFVTFRSPERLSLIGKEVKFVSHPDFSNSHFKDIALAGQQGNEQLIQQLISSFTPLKTYKEVRNLSPAIYDFSSMILKKKIKLADIPALIQQNQALQALAVNQEVQIFDNLIYQVLTKDSKDVRQAVSQILIANNVIKNISQLNALGIKKVTDTKIEVPHQVVDKIKPELFKNCDGELHGVTNLGIADFRRVEQEVCCYVPGEVSHIENVMAREYKERSTRNYVRTEDTTESTRETEIENLSDTTTAVRNELSSEIANVLDQDKTNNYGGSLGVSGGIKGGPSYNINAFADFSSSTSSSYSNTEAKQYAQEITERALERIVQKTSEKRTSKIIKEFEENYKHGYDNRNGDAHVTGIYRWIDLIYTNRLVNYGKRLVVEFMAPEPAEFYKRMQKYKVWTEEDQETQENIILEAPKTLAELGINSYADITRENYSVIASNYGVILTAPMEEFKDITTSILPPCPKNSDNSAKAYSQAIMIEPNYEADSVSGKIDYNYRWLTGPTPILKMDIATFNVTVGTFPKDKSKTATKPFGAVLSPKVTGSMDVNFDYKKMNSITASIQVKCKLTAAKFQEWQEECYNKMMNAYNNALNNHNNTIEIDDEVEEGYVEEKYTNPAMHRIIEQRELKRICIEMLMKPFCREQGRKNYTDENACDLYEIPKVNQTLAFAKYAEQVKFFEQAIDWQLMSYLFYPYYWADKCDWGALLQSENGNDDLIFQAFLQSGMARVVVPIRLSSTEAFAYYLETGDIWTGGELVAGTESDLYLSIAEEMMEVEGVVEEEWETRVPTTLAIIQGKSAFLEQEGLPCCHDEEATGETTNIIPSENILGNILPPSTPE